MLTTTSVTRRLTAALAAAALALAVPCAAAEDHTHVHDTTGMEQHVAADEQIAPAGQRVAIHAGHIDIGPLLVNGQLQLLFRDDSAAHPVWRRFEDATFILSDKAENTLPAGHDYDFTGATAGQQVWAVPQNQVAGVPWMGWSTQAPSVAEVINTGVTFSFGPHSGPGQMSLFVQSGGFGGPDVIYQSDKPQPQTVFVDLHTHAHMNWVFTAPGTHRLTVGVSGTTKTGQELSSSAVITFVVGNDSAVDTVPHAANTDDSSRSQDKSSATPTTQASSSTVTSSSTIAPVEETPSVTPSEGTVTRSKQPAANDSVSSKSSTTMWLVAGMLILGAVLLGVATIVVRRRREAAAVLEATPAGDADA